MKASFAATIIELQFVICGGFFSSYNTAAAMVYKAIGLMSGSSLDGLDIAYVQFQETAGKWDFEILHAACHPYTPEWLARLSGATSFSALDYQLAHTAYGHYIGGQVNEFIAKNQLEHQVHLICSHGHTVFHRPDKKMTAQLGDGAAIAAVTGLPVVSDLRAMDVALAGEGAPIVPIGEKLLLPGYDLFLNLGGIANISFNHPNRYTAFDICPANRVLNIIAAKLGKAYDDGGEIAASGKVNEVLFNKLNALPYYGLPFPKSLANDFGTDEIYPMLEQAGLHHADLLRTYVEHIAFQIAKSVSSLAVVNEGAIPAGKLLATGGGAHNHFLVKRIAAQLQSYNIEVVVPSHDLINYKEAVVMALIGVLRWREEYNVIASATGASRNSINGALWLGGDA